MIFIAADTEMQKTKCQKWLKSSSLLNKDEKTLSQPPAYFVWKQYDVGSVFGSSWRSYSLKGGGGGIGSQGAEGKGGGMEKGNPGTVAPGPAVAPSVLG